MRSMRKFIQRLRDTRYFTYIFISLWKMLCFFCCLLLILFLKGESVPNFFLVFKDAFSARQIVVTEVSKSEYSVL
jgi:chitin synthase